MSNENNDKPYFMEDGTLVIPFSCPDHSYKYWKKEGKKLSEVLAEIGADRETWKRFTADPYPDDVTPESPAEDGED
ncbi:hypothetical protein [Maridesulfovibrio sp.]|uniref:hypothetical protein n=1 Tax=Maridesulfovibrio sp. TaxID=2795000 RepID=UPI002A18D889|nr:hypothetical protein [Maridesulfovibrio sp.]